MNTMDASKNGNNFKGIRNFKLYSEVQNAIKNVKMKKYINESKAIVAEGTSFFGAINGENALQLERIKNVNLKMELLPICISGRCGRESFCCWDGTSVPL